LPQSRADSKLKHKMTRTILHLDLDAFFCAVEEQRDPTLRGKAFAVGGRPDQRGVVASCSYAARKYGVRSAMPMARALRLCPDLRIVGQHFDAYRDLSRQVMSILHHTTPLVEQLSIDEAFLDIGNQDGYESARHLQEHINTALSLPCSFGIASNKLVAKIANTVGKAEASTEHNRPPNAIKVVPSGQEATFLAPLSINELWGVGPKTGEQLRQMDIHTIGDLVRWSPQDLIRRFGKLGGELHVRAQGIDDRPVQPDHETKSISKETTFASDIRDADPLLRMLRDLCDGVGWRLRREGLKGDTVKIKLRWSDFTTLTRQTTLDQPVDQDEAIYAAAHTLFRQHWPQGKAVRLLGVGISGFDTSAQQLRLWDDPQDNRLQSALDAIKDRFGENVIRRGTTFRHDD
jgi:DNA polymerase IV